MVCLLLQLLESLLWKLHPHGILQNLPLLSSYGLVDRRWYVAKDYQIFLLWEIGMQQESFEHMADKDVLLHTHGGVYLI